MKTKNNIIRKLFEAILSSTIISVVSLHAQRCVGAPAGLIAWWQGEGNANDALGANNGSLLGGTSFTPALTGTGFTFDSNDDGVTIPHNTALDINPTGFTVECWMQGIKNQPDPSRYLVVDKSHGWTDVTGWALQGDSGSGLIAFGIAQGDTATFGEIFSAVDVLDGHFHHVAGTWDGATMRLYVDGVVQNSLPLATPANNTRPVNMGFSWGGGSPTRFFRGVLDEVRLYRRALSATEVQAIYCGSADCGNPPVLWTGNCHYYEFVPGTFTWQEARAAALSRTHLGVPGHLVTITSAAENAFINFAFNTGIDSRGAWIGAYERADDGVWRWADGPEAGIQFSFWATATAPFNYANWGGIEPSNTRPPDENYAWMNIGGPFPGVGSGEWADSISTPNPLDPIVGYIVEYSPLFAEDGVIWHQPLARNGASEDTDPSVGRTVKYRFKRGSTIPIQVHALGCTAEVTSNANVIGKVTVFGDSNCDGAVDGNDAAIDFNGVGAGGGVMDKIGGHLKYNLDTKSLPTTTQCYILRVTVTDTSTGEEKFEEVLLQAK